MVIQASAADFPLDTVQSLAADFRQFVASLNRPRLRDPAWLRSAQRRCHELTERFSLLTAALASRRQALAAQFEDTRAQLQVMARALSGKLPRRRLAEMRGALARRYEDLLVQVRAARLWRESARDRPRSLRLPQLARSVFHMAVGLTAALLYQFVLSRGLALGLLFGLLAIFAGLEISRRFSPRFNDFMVYRLFGAISRPQERYRINSASYYLLALTVITLVAPRPAVCAAVLILAFGDPLASLVGSRYGRLRLANDKSLEGSLAFVAAAGVATAVYLLAFGEGYSVLGRLGIAACLALVGAAVELFSGRLDDNFTIPVACALAGCLWF